jgi:hypothetical protein
MTSSNAPSRNGSGAPQVGGFQARASAEPLPGQLQHLGAFIGAGHDGAPVTRRREQRTGAAAGVEDPPASHVPGQGPGSSRTEQQTNSYYCHRASDRSDTDHQILGRSQQFRQGALKRSRVCGPLPRGVSARCLRTRAGLCRSRGSFCG